MALKHRVEAPVSRQSGRTIKALDQGEEPEASSDGSSDGLLARATMSLRERPSREPLKFRY
jgi:hypothetical protein